MAEYSLELQQLLHPATQTGTNYYFGSMLIKNGNSPTNWVYSDRLGSVGKFFPYGVERPSATTNGTEKFTGYFRDNETGNDYADQRYMSAGTGRFLTPWTGRTVAHPIHQAGTSTPTPRATPLIERTRAAGTGAKYRWKRGLLKRRRRVRRC